MKNPTVTPALEQYSDPIGIVNARTDEKHEHMPPWFSRLGSVDSKHGVKPLYTFPLPNPPLFGTIVIHTWQPMTKPDIHYVEATLVVAQKPFDWQLMR